MVKTLYVLGGIFIVFTALDPMFIAFGWVEPIGMLYDALTAAAFTTLAYGIDCFRKGI